MICLKRDTSVEGLFLHVLEGFIDVIGEFLYVFGVHMAITGSGNDAFGIVLVFNFHTSEATDVYIGAEVATSGSTFRNIHIQVESLVSFILAVGDAGLLLSGFNLAEVSIYAVLVALIEQEGWKCGGHPGLSLILRVLCPIRNFSILLTIIISTLR